MYIGFETANIRKLLHMRALFARNLIEKCLDLAQKLVFKDTTICTKL
jgi:hypothetical protein